MRGEEVWGYLETAARVAKATLEATLEGSALAAWEIQSTELITEMVRNAIVRRGGDEETAWEAAYEIASGVFLADHD